MKNIGFNKVLCLLFTFVLISLTTACASDVISRNPIEVKQLNDHIWLMNDNNESTGFVVVGSEKAAVIDTMNGYEDVQKIARTITDLPLIVINTHGHSDHIYGNAYFDEVYIHPNDLNLAWGEYNYFNYQTIQAQFDLKPVKFLTTEEGDVFDLGGVSLEVYHVPGHTQGGICLLDREDKVLFTGDTINKHCWMQLYNCTPMEDFYESLENLKGIRGEYDYILHGHTQDFVDASVYEDLMAAVKEVIDGVNDKDTEYQYYGGTCMQHPFPTGEGVVVYNP
ncbi:MAG TPA: MBL fold metallo-hydrolase [Lachnospiraceae bacterium]|nr:MBL fold metallo-hydrolase [Lachnospiraceae bacterium]